MEVVHSSNLVCVAFKLQLDFKISSFKVSIWCTSCAFDCSWRDGATPAPAASMGATTATAAGTVSIVGSVGSSVIVEQFGQTGTGGQVLSPEKICPPTGHTVAGGPKDIKKE